MKNYKAKMKFETRNFTKKQRKLKIFDFFRYIRMYVNVFLEYNKEFKGKLKGFNVKAKTNI